MLAVSIPTDRLSRIRSQVDAGLPNVQVVDEPGYSSGEGDTGSGGGTGSSKTLRNLAIGGGIALAAYLAYSLLLPPKRAAASAPVSGVRGGRKGKRRRRGGSLKGRKPTIYEALYQRLGREPTNDELRAEVNRIKREAYEDLATSGKLPYQRRRR